MIGVLVADDYALMMKTLRPVLEAQPALKLVGEAADGTAASSSPSMVVVYHIDGRPYPTNEWDRLDPSNLRTFA